MKGCVPSPLGPGNAAMFFRMESNEWLDELIFPGVS